MGILLVMIVGMILILRGGPTDVLEDPLTERWQRLADLPTARTAFATVLYANQVYTIGGETSLGVTGVMERYNPSQDTWSTLETKPIPVSEINAAVIGERIYVPGGLLDSGEPTDLVEVYDPLLSTWSRVSSLPTKLAGYAMVAYEGKLYLFGGWDGESFRAEVYSYDPEDDLWIERTPMLTPRAYASATKAGSVIYVIGGFNGKVSLNVNEAYHPSRDVEGGLPWILQAPLPSGRYGMGVAGLADRIFVFGGHVAEQGNNWILQYIPQSDEWQIFSESPIEGNRHHLGFVPFEGNLLIMGGESEDGIFAEHYAYQAMYNMLLPALLK
jgi:N-acetylneuraminic acid mutarotase